MGNACEILISEFGVIFSALLYTLYCIGSLAKLRNYYLEEV